MDALEPFSRPLRRRWNPPEMSRPPMLDPSAPANPLEPRYALLINPFYPKDPNASFGKHALTPTLALTSFAAATPEHWRVQYWDENLIDGRPPFQPMPEVVGITVHLTFARRAFELADWYRRRGSKVIMGGLHVLSQFIACDRSLNQSDAAIAGIAREGDEYPGSIRTSHDPEWMRGHGDIVTGRTRRRMLRLAGGVEADQ
jgi:hypothetical protein